MWKEKKMYYDHGTSGVKPVYDDSGAIDLASRIVAGIADEYRSAYRQYLDSRNEAEMRSNLAMLRTYEGMIKSSYFAALSLSQLDPDVIIESLKLQVEKEIGERGKK